MKKIFTTLSLLSALFYMVPSVMALDFTDQGEYVGSSDCRSCHERFYKLWSTSHHGTAMQAFSASLAKTLAPMTEPIRVNDQRFIVEFTDQGGVFKSISDAGVEKVYPIRHALGGRNVYFFLLPMDKGKLQVAPLAYYVHKKMWYNATQSMVRHFTNGMRDEAIDWTDRLLTFNTACHDCHVSQLEKNYSVEDDSYHTTWKEAGINCETCHGPAEAHIIAAQKAEAEGRELTDLKLLRFHEDLDMSQRDATCGPCHAKMTPLTRDFTPGEQFFDHYDLTGYESPDFFADGRDLGENYTQTGWMANACAQSGELECIHCHTSSGRFRFADNPNQACMPCHEHRVKNVSAHSHHPADSEGSQCIKCHMPVTAQAYMTRSDHSFRPPAPAASLEFESPNACTLCHNDKDGQWNKVHHKKEDVEWANKHVKKWHGEGSQDDILKLGHIITACREQKWEKLPEILEYLESDGCDQPSAVGIMRLLIPCPDPAKWPVLRRQMNDPAPWIRATAANGLEHDLSPATTDLLMKAVQDPVRIVRIRAASSLLGRDVTRYSEAQRNHFEAANEEYWHSLVIWPDRWSSYYNQGLYHDRLGNDAAALKAYERATELRSDVLQPLINAAMVHARAGENDKAYALLQRALNVEPENAMVNFNLALLEAEFKNMDACETHLRAALKGNPEMAQAAYNLGVLLGQKKDPESLEWLRSAALMVPQSWQYTSSTLYFLNQFERGDESEGFLRRMIGTKHAAADTYMALIRQLQSQDRIGEVLQLYKQMKMALHLPAEARRFAAQMEKQLKEN